MRAQLWAGLRALLVLTVLCGVIYPLAVTAAAQVVTAGSLPRPPFVAIARRVESGYPY